ncbi:MAG TPA: hypothetical protein VKR06_44630 [Ktedonosporobacter sp.]|nr:hypothetical protein [Ktedonosporobacter sp.]
MHLRGEGGEERFDLAASGACAIPSSWDVMTCSSVCIASSKPVKSWRTPFPRRSVTWEASVKRNWREYAYRHRQDYQIIL